MIRLVDWLAGSLLATLAMVAILAGVGIVIGRAFDLSWAGSAGLYFIVWWLVLFTILPVRIDTQSDRGEVTAGTDPGAPASPAILHRAIWTSIAGTLVFTLVAALFPLAGL